MKTRSLHVVEELEIKAQDIWERLVAGMKQDPDEAGRRTEKEVDALVMEKDASGNNVVSRTKLNKVVNFLSPRMLKFSLSGEPSDQIAGGLIYSLWTNHYLDLYSAEDKMTLSKKLVSLNENITDPQMRAENYYAALQLGGRNYPPEEYKDLLVTSLDAAMKIENELFADNFALWMVREAKKTLGEKSTMGLIMRKYEVQHVKWTEGFNGLVGLIDPYEVLDPEMEYIYTTPPGLNAL